MISVVLTSFFVTFAFRQYKNRHGHKVKRINWYNKTKLAGTKFLISTILIRLERQQWMQAVEQLAEPLDGGWLVVLACVLEQWSWGALQDSRNPDSAWLTGTWLEGGLGVSLSKNLLSQKPCPLLLHIDEMQCIKPWYTIHFQVAYPKPRSYTRTCEKNWYLAVGRWNDFIRLYVL